MEWQAWTTISAVGLMIGLMSLTRIGPDLITLAVLTLLLTLGVVTAEQALAGFSNEGMITVAVLSVVAAGLRETGAMAGLAYLLLACRWLLPDRRSAFGEQEDPRQYTVEMLVEPASPLVGQTIEEAGLRHLPGLYLVEIDREGHVLAAVAPHERLRANDRLVFAGIVDSV